MTQQTPLETDFITQGTDKDHAQNREDVELLRAVLPQMFSFEFKR